MPKNKLIGKVLSLGISILMITLLFFDLIPVSSAVFVSPGAPNDTSVNIGTTITFDNVNLTIRGPERIPVSFLNFAIFNGNTEIAHVKFDIDGTVIEQDPSSTFTVTILTDISSIPYGSGGSYYGYDEMDGTNHSFGYGYGYGSVGYSDIHILYRITYTTHMIGTFYAKLFVDSASHTYISGISAAFTVSSESVPPAEIYVDDDNTAGPWSGTSDYPYQAIQAGIDAVSSGGTIYVHSGTYNENVDISKSVNLIGAGAGDTIVRDLNSDNVFYVSADRVNIIGFTVEEADFSKMAGIYIDGADFCNLSDNNVSDNYYGIRLKSSNSNILTGNTVFSNVKYGIFLEDSSINALMENNALGNTDGIYLTGSSSNTLTGNDVSSNTNGIYFEGSSSNTLMDNNASGNTNGIYFEGSSSNNLMDNYAFGNTDGIHLISSSDNVITSNNVLSNIGNGFNIRFSSGNSIRDNMVLDNTYGIYLFSCSGNIICNNYFDNMNNAWDDGNNKWNVTTIISGTNIIGYPYLGGNYWHDYIGLDVDEDGLGDSLTPYTCSAQIVYGGDYHPLTEPATNNPPNRPSRPFGQTSGKPDKPYTYQTFATDPDGGKLYYMWDWGGGITSDWLGPYDSGEFHYATHSWSSRGSYEIRVKAKDEFGTEGTWSDPLPIRMPKNKQSSTDSLFLQLLERFLEHFPLLERIIHFLQSLLNNILSRLNDLR